MIISTAQHNTTGRPRHPAPELDDADFLQHAYVQEERTLQDIARELGCSQGTVWRALVRAGIPRRPPVGQPVVFVGDVYGRLTVTAETERNARGGRRYECRCECGQQTIVNADKLRSGWTRSCGCAHSTHGLTGSPAHGSWLGMIARTTNPKNTNWKNYGGRGIRICERFRQDFRNFHADMGDRPEGTSIDRVNNDGHYSCGHCPECLERGWPSNLRWATPIEQNNNQRSGGTAQSRSELAGNEEVPLVRRTRGRPRTRTDRPTELVATHVTAEQLATPKRGSISFG